jgi:hypothetical protein
VNGPAFYCTAANASNAALAGLALPLGATARDVVQRLSAETSAGANRHNNVRRRAAEERPQKFNAVSPRMCER